MVRESLAQSLPSYGRETTLDVTALYKPSPDDLTSYQNIVAQSTSIEWNNGTHTLTVGMNAQTYFKKIVKKLDIDKCTSSR